MKEAWLSLGDSFTIRDESGQSVYKVDSRLLSLGDHLTLRDMQGVEQATISQKLLSWGPTYEISRGGQRLAVVKKELFTFFRTSFEVDVPGPNDLKAEGDFWHREYTFLRGETAVARVSQQFFSMTDTYGIEVASGEDDVLILASAVVIDQCLNDKK
jgi:uncharacterized protein YxjI